MDYGRDFEQQLQFYVEARGSFASFDAVLAQLVQVLFTFNSLILGFRGMVSVREFIGH